MKAFRSIWKRNRRLEDLAFLTEVMTQFSVKVVDYLQPDFCWDAEVQHATLNVGQFLGRKCGHFPSRTLQQSAISNETTTMRRISCSDGGTKPCPVWTCPACHQKIQEGVVDVEASRRGSLLGRPQDFSAANQGLIKVARDSLG